MRKLLGTHALDFFSVNREVLGNETVWIGHPQFRDVWDRSDCLQVNKEHIVPNLQEICIKIRAIIFRPVPPFSLRQILRKLFSHNGEFEFFSIKIAKTVFYCLEIELKPRFSSRMSNRTDYLSNKSRTAEKPVRRVT